MFVLKIFNVFSYVFLKCACVCSVKYKNKIRISPHNLSLVGSIKNSKRKVATREISKKTKWKSQVLKLMNKKKFQGIKVTKVYAQC